jgi:hypothetical protein
MNGCRRNNMKINRLYENFIYITVAVTVMMDTKANHKRYGNEDINN